MITNKCEHFVGCLTRDGRLRVVSAYSTDCIRVYAILAYVDEEWNCSRMIYENGNKRYSVGDSVYDIMLPTPVVEDGEYPRVEDDSWDDTWVVLKKYQPNTEYTHLCYALVMPGDQARSLANQHGYQAVRIAIHD